MLKVIYKNCSVFNYPKIIHCDNGSVFQDPQELQDHERVSAIWVEDLNSISNKMNNAKPKDEIKLDIGKLDKSETQPMEVSP